MSVGVPSYSLAIQTDGDPVPLSVKSGTIRFDESWSPYCQADLTIVTPDEATLELLDPRDSVRLTLTASMTWPAAFNRFPRPDTSRTFDLLLRSRSIDQVSAETELTLASDDAMLHDLALVDSSSDASALQYQSSLRGLLNTWLLPKLGSGIALESGTADADVTTTTSLTNVVPNGDMTGGTASTPPTGYTATGSTINGADTSWAKTGSNSMCITSSASVNSWASTGTESSTAFQFGLQPGNTYTATVWANMKTATTGTSVGALERTLTFYWYDGAAYHTFTSNQCPNVINTPTRLSVTFTIPDNATGGFFRLFLGNSVGAIRYDDFMIVEGDGLETDGVTPLAYFDGTIHPDAAHYSYAWTGTANASSSHRVPLVDRSPAALTWEPGDSLWDLINPILSATSLRLFCDEQRKWRLIDLDYSLSGGPTIAAGSNALTGSESISRDDATWADGVVVHYSWTNAQGQPEDAYDAAGADGIVKVVEYQRPYPGPGAAAYILHRSQGTGRVISTSTVSDFSAQPYQPITVVMPLTPTETGVLSTVTWDVSSDEMQITSRGLTDTPPNAIVLAPSGLRIIDIPNGHPVDTLDWSTI